MQKALGPRSKKKKIKNHMMNKTAKHSYKLFHLFQEFAFLKSNTAILPTLYVSKQTGEAEAARSLILRPAWSL